MDQMDQVVFFFLMAKWENEMIWQKDTPPHHPRKIIMESGLFQEEETISNVDFKFVTKAMLSDLQLK